MVVWDIDPPGGGGPTIIRHWIAHHGHVNAVAFTPPTASSKASSSGATTDIDGRDGGEGDGSRGGRHAGGIRVKIVSGGADQTVKIWDGSPSYLRGVSANDMHPLRTCEGHSQQVVAVCFSSEGTQVRPNIQCESEDFPIPIGNFLHLFYRSESLQL